MIKPSGKAVLLTRHQKANWVGPALLKAKLDVIEYQDFDTDTLGTFCNTIERVKTAKETAEHKAKLACQFTGSRLGLGSEGSFSQHAIAGLTWEQEIICLYDAAEETALFGLSEGPAAVVTVDVANMDDVIEIIQGTEPQKWMWRSPQGNWHKALAKQELLALFDQGKVSFPQTLVPDYRAMNSPFRQVMIAKAADDLATRLTSTCPVCSTINFVYDRKQSGLPCHACTLPTQVAKGWWATCNNCGFEDYAESPDAFAESQHCQYCNP